MCACVLWWVSVSEMFMCARTHVSRGCAYGSFACDSIVPYWPGHKVLEKGQGIGHKHARGHLSEPTHLRTDPHTCCTLRTPHHSEAVSEVRSAHPRGPGPAKQTGIVRAPGLLVWCACIAHPPDAACEGHTHTHTHTHSLCLLEIISKTYCRPSIPLTRHPSLRSATHPHARMHSCTQGVKLRRLDTTTQYKLGTHLCPLPFSVTVRPCLLRLGFKP